MNYVGEYSPQDAHRALADVAAARDRLADRAPSPRWVHAGFALSFGIAFAAPSIAGSMAVRVVVVMLTICVPVLSLFAMRSTGVGLRTWHSGPRATRLGFAALGALLPILAIGGALQWIAGLWWRWASAAWWFSLCSWSSHRESRRPACGICAKATRPR